MKRKPRRCRICKKSPVWTRGDVKNPGQVCKRCYHKHVWPERKAATRQKPSIQWFEDEQGEMVMVAPSDGWSEEMLTAEPTDESYWEMLLADPFDESYWTLKL